MLQQQIHCANSVSCGETIVSYDSRHHYHQLREAPPPAMETIASEEETMIAVPIDNDNANRAAEIIVNATGKGVAKPKTTTRRTGGGGGGKRNIGAGGHSHITGDVVPSARTLKKPARTYIKLIADAIMVRTLYEI